MLLREFYTDLLQDLRPSFNQLGVLIKEQDLFIRDGIQFRLWRKDEECPGLSNILYRAGGGIFTEKLILVHSVKVFEKGGAGIFVSLKIDLLPFGIKIGPEPGKELIDIGIRRTASFACKIL